MHITQSFCSRTIAFTILKSYEIILPEFLFITKIGVSTIGPAAKVFKCQHILTHFK